MMVAATGRLLPQTRSSEHLELRSGTIPIGILSRLSISDQNVNSIARGYCVSPGLDMGAERDMAHALWRTPLDLFAVNFGKRNLWRRFFISAGRGVAGVALGIGLAQIHPFNVRQRQMSQWSCQVHPASPFSSRWHDSRAIESDHADTGLKLKARHLARRYLGMRLHRGSLTTQYSVLTALSHSPNPVSLPQ